jgi:hypothetical protein
MAATGKRARSKLARSKVRKSVGEQLVARDGNARPGAIPKRAPSDTCNGRKVNGKGYCSRPAGWGTSHVGFGRCKRHGGSTKKGKEAAQKLMAESLADAYGLPVDVDPHTALLEELHRTAGHVAFLGQLVGALPEEELHGHVGTAGTSEGKTYLPRSEQHVLISMYQRERKHLADVATDCITAGIEERRVRIAESQAQMLARVIDGVLEELKVERTPATGKVVAKHLKLIADEGRQLEAAS